MKQSTLQICHFERYCKTQRRLSESTIRAYDLDLKLFTIFLEKQENPMTDFEKVTRQTLCSYLNSMEGYSVKTIKRKFACLRSLFKFLEYEDIIVENPFHRFELNLREPYKIRTTMTLEEVNRILSTAYAERPREVTDIPEDYAACNLIDGSFGSITERKIVRNDVKITSEEFIWTRDIAILELLFAGGLRVSELCNIKLRDLNLRYMSIMLHGKGNKERMVYLENNEVVNAINRYLYFRKGADLEGTDLFITKFGDKLSTQAVRNMVTKYTKIAKIGKNITPHAFRHSFATLLLEEGVDIKYIQDFLGHSSISTTQIYLHTTNRQKRQIMATKHPRQRLNMTDPQSSEANGPTPHKGDAV